MNAVDVQLLFEYNDWANRLLLAKSALVTPEQWDAPTTHSWGSLHGTLVHLLDSEHAWRVALETGDWNAVEMQPDDLPTLEAVQERWQVEEAAWDAYLARLSDADLAKTIHYTLPEGGFRERVLWHCLFHVVNHGMQHRSEAAHMLTQYGQSPGGLDFTGYMNNR